MNIYGGLNELPDDGRDLHLGNIVTLPSPTELPPTFSLGETIIRDQGGAGDNDFCTAYGTVAAAYLQDGVEGSQAWVFAASKAISGNEEAFGQDMRTIYKAWVKYGSPKRKLVEVPQSLSHKRYLDRYNLDLIKEAKRFKKRTYVTCKGPYDAYDNIRTSIWKYRDEKRAVGIGVVFSWPLSQTHLAGSPSGGFGHFMICTGWTDEGLEIVNSYGMSAGDKGKHTMARETINHYVKRYGAYMMIDLPAEKAREIQDSTIYNRASRSRRLRIRFRKWYNRNLNLRRIYKIGI